MCIKRKYIDSKSIALELVRKGLQERCFVFCTFGSVTCFNLHLSFLRLSLDRQRSTSEDSQS